LKENHRKNFYRCLTEKLLTYALGRGLEYYDEVTVDRIVDQLEIQNGQFSALINGVIDSSPFQKRRSQTELSASLPGARKALVTNKTE
jgi:cyclophilin family peptidyl-prolyl cis-trans isomerase